MKSIIWIGFVALWVGCGFWVALLLDIVVNLPKLITLKFLERSKIHFGIVGGWLDVFLRVLFRTYRIV